MCKKTFKLLNSTGGQVVAIYRGREIYQDEFLHHVGIAKKKLLSHQYAINLCENRYHFLVTFAACMSLNQVSLFPNSKAEAEIKGLGGSYADSYLINDADVNDICESVVVSSNPIKNIDIDAQQIVAILFTSGTTGKPKENPKTWSQLNEGAIRVGRRFWPNGVGDFCIVATVPPQHMFGFETTIIYPLVLGICVHDGHPFYPLDIQQVSSATLERKVLVTTPLHLKACTSLETNWHNIDSVVCATSPLSKDIANKSETVFDANVYEIYGCSEAGAIATRQTSKGDQWQLLDDYKIDSQANKTVLSAIGYNDLIAIPDTISMIDNTHFYLLGRENDLIKIGGKRTSLVNLTRQLKSIISVEDGIMFVPQQIDGQRIRLAAIVVSPANNVKLLVGELTKLFDPVFLPRPIVFVDKLPYNSVGKLKLSDLLAILK